MVQDVVSKFKCRHCSGGIYKLSSFALTHPTSLRQILGQGFLGYFCRVEKRLRVIVTNGLGSFFKM